MPNERIGIFKKIKSMMKGTSLIVKLDTLHHEMTFLEDKVVNAMNEMRKLGDDVIALSAKIDTVTKEANAEIESRAARFHSQD